VAAASTRSAPLHGYTGDMRYPPAALALATAAALAACDDGDPDPAPAPPAAVLARTETADAAACPTGGSRVLAGPDRDGDGVLDDDEVTTRTIVCAPAAVLVRITDEPAGARCAHGGAAVASGPDRNGNQVLDDGEIAGVEYVCDDAVLTRLDAEPAGAHCADGGVAFRTGRDRDGDGALADEEVELVERECSDVLTRPIVTVRTSADVLALSRLRAIHGALSVGHDTALTALELPRLEHVGALDIRYSPTLTRVSLPALVTIDTDLVISGVPTLATIDVPVLDRIGRSVEIAGNPALTTDVLAGLDAIGGGVSLRQNGALTALRLEQSARTGVLSVEGNARLERITVRDRGFEDRVGAVIIAANPALTRVDIDAGIEGVLIHGNDALTSVRLDRRSAPGAGQTVILESPVLDRVEILGHSDPLHAAGIVSIEGPITLLAVGPGLFCHSLELTGSRLTALDAPTMVATEDVLLENNPVLARAHVTSASSLRVHDNPALVDLTTDAWALLELELLRNGALTSLRGLDPVERVGSSVTIIDNPTLPTCAVDALLARVDPARETVSGNDDAGVCP
jgi:hypothetical protein